MAINLNRYGREYNPPSGVSLSLYRALHPSHRLATSTPAVKRSCLENVSRVRKVLNTSLPARKDGRHRQPIDQDVAGCASLYEQRMCVYIWKPVKVAISTQTSNRSIEGKSLHQRRSQQHRLATHNHEAVAVLSSGVPPIE